MRANAGDWLIVSGYRVGDHERGGEIIDVHGPAGTAPYAVRWSDTGHEGLVFPGSDAMIQHAHRQHVSSRWSPIRVPSGTESGRGG